MNPIAAGFGRALGRWLSREHHVHGTSPPPSQAALAATLHPADVLLVEGRTRVSVAIKYLTQSTWSHAALYVGDCGQGAPHCFVEADIVEGIRVVGLEEFAGLHSRICRPVGLTDTDRRRVVEFALARDDCPDCVEEILRVRHHSLFVPRDFDVSPYFQIVKPTLEQGFDYRRLAWAEEVAA